MGRNWLSVIRLNWNNIFDINTAYKQYTCKINEHNGNISTQQKLSEFLNIYLELFTEDLEHIKDIKAKINIKGDATPKFCKARAVPFAMKEAVEQEIERLHRYHIQNGRVQLSVPKADGRVRICGDYKTTINPVIENETYPDPTVDEVFEKMKEVNYL